MLSLCQSKKGRIPQPFPHTLTLSGTPTHASQAAKDGSAASSALFRPRASGGGPYPE